MSMKKIRKDDEVIVIAGKDKGKIGKVSRILEDKLVIDGVNVVKKHTKPNPAKNITGGILAKTMPIHVSNVALYNADSKKADRVGFKVEAGKKVRVFKSSGKVVD